MSKPRHPSAGKSREEHSAAVTNRLLDAAEALYAAEGPSALTNRRIASQAGTTIQPIYSFFRSHDALVDAMFARCLDSLVDLVMDTHQMAATDGGNGSGLPALYRAYCLEYPGRFRFVRSAGAGTPKAGLARHQRDLLANSFQKLGDDDSVVDGRIVFAAVNGFILAELEGLLPLAEGNDRLYEELVAGLLRPRP